MGVCAAASYLKMFWRACEWEILEFNLFKIQFFSSSSDFVHFFNRMQMYLLFIFLYDDVCFHLYHL